MNHAATPSISNESWLLLILLSILWGGSFLFIGIAVKELPSLLIVFVRVAIAAAVLLPVHWLLQGALPRDAKTWIAVGGMSIVNNVIPFSLIVYGQHSITSGLASVINASTPFFGAVFMAVAAIETLRKSKIAGLVIGLVGVMVLRGVSLTDFNQESLGILAVLAASASYGVSSLWAKKRLGGVPPVTSATCQLMCSSIVMALLVAVFSDYTLLGQASFKTWAALAGLAVFSTSIAYLLFFRIIATAGPSVVLLVTMLIPVPAIIMGSVFLGEVIVPREIAGAALIALGLLVIDGRALAALRRSSPTKP
jgi:drug/metabolite transporter (DMT)-like permease